MRFYKLPDAQAATGALANRLTAELTAKKHVLWLVSGGSNVAIETAVMRALPAESQSRLAVMPIDERFGAFGHSDSNMRQLYDAGFVPDGATVVSILTQDNLSIEATAERYQAAIKTAFDSADIIIAQLGLGPDGHIAGILPNSSAITATGLVTSYHTEQFDRITLTFEALKKATAAYTFAFGANKREQLERLRNENVPLAQQPAQILRAIPETYVYNDQIGESI